MYAALRPLLFALSPHAAHAAGMAALGAIEHAPPLRAALRASLGKPDPRLAVGAMGLTFPSPIGLAGGFDKNALRPRALAALGFGFLELGTVTAQAQAPNPAPNMFRLPEDRAIVNRLGFPNAGAPAVCARIARLARSEIGVPVGVSIGKSRAVGLEPIEGALADYVASFREAKKVADFVVVNVSSPNTKDLRAMQGADIARALFAEITRANVNEGGKGRVPVLVKIAPDLSDAELEALLAVVEQAKLDGVVATNTTIARKGLKTAPARVEAIGAGGLSGPPVRARALEVVARVRARLGAQVTVIGVGGIEGADDVLAFVRAGADLVQMYTGFVYGGPLLPHRIARELAERMEREKVSSVEGVAARR